MNLNSILEDNLIIICSNNLKKKILLNLNTIDKMYDLKFYSFNEIKKALFFNYDEKTLYYLVNNYHLSYRNALDYIDNMYYLLDEEYNNDKLNNLVNIKKELINNNLLTLDNYFYNYLKNKKIIIYGYSYLDKWQIKIIDLLKKITDVKIFSFNKKYQHDIYAFNYIDDEIEYIANDIINKGLDLNHVYIANLNGDYKYTIKRIFNNYHLNINIDDKHSLYENKYALDYLNNLNINEVKDSNIKNMIINILNKYYFIKDQEELKLFLNYEFKNNFIPSIKYSNSINEIDLKDNFISDEDYVYLIGFNSDNIPFNYKDEDYINDKEKLPYMAKTYEKNNDEIIRWINIINNIKNLTISYSNNNLKGSLIPSMLASNYNIIKINYEYSRYSNQSNKYNLAKMLDEYLKYGTLNKNLNILLNSYPDNTYLKYSNKYQKINFNENFSLSYTKLNSYYECPFKYYCDYILKLKPFEQTFDAYAGSLCHYILSKLYEDNFNFNLIKEEYLKDNPFAFTLENKVFLNKMLKELEYVTKYLIEQLKQTKYQKIECEKDIDINIDGLRFVGIIDKIMKNDNNLVIVDYKTGETDIDLKYANNGLKLQLPVYIYLIKKIYPDSKIVGIYLEHIISPVINFNENKSYIDQVNDNLKLCGYTINNEELIKDFDPTYEKSEYIKGMSMTSNGFSKNSKLLSEDDFNNLAIFTEKKIKEAIDNIKNANFIIEPKINGQKNMSCLFCPYKSICFTNESDHKIIYEDADLNYLRDTNEGR